MRMLPTLLSDPAIPRMSKMFALRKAYKLDGLPRDEIMTLVPPSYDELDAERIVLLVNMNRLPDNLPDIFAGRDIETYLIILARADDTPAKAIVMEAIRRAMAIQEQAQVISDLN